MIEKLNKLSIKWKISLSVSIYILLVLFGSIIFTAISFQKSMITDKENNLYQNIAKLSESYKESFITSNLEKLDELSRFIKSIESVEEVNILDKDFKIIASSNINNLGKKKQIEKEKNKFIYPVSVYNDIIGYVEVKYNKDILKEIINKEIFSILIKTFFIGFFVIFASFIGTFFISGIMINPLKELKNKIVNLFSSDINNLDKIELPTKNCKNKNCIKFEEIDCWLCAENSKDILLSLRDKTIKECPTCEKYRYLIGDEIEQLSYSFYIMVSALNDYVTRLEEIYRERETLSCMATMGEMSAKIAHEVKNALYAISNAVNYMKNNVNNPIVKEFSILIKEEINRLNEMTTAFLNFSKLIEPTFKKENINQIIKESIFLLKDDFEDEGIEIIFDLDEKIPEIYLDKNLIKQTIFNLALNSIDALREKDEEKKYFKIATKQKKDKVLVIIEDNGIGIKEEYKDKVFKPFFTTKQKGTGLGLPMVYKIIFTHNGIINMKSEYGKGTTFYIEFPVYNEYAKSIND